MPTTYTIEVSDAEKKALEYIFYSPQEWIESVVRERSNSAMQEIVNYEMRMAEIRGTKVSGTVEEVVLSSNVRSVVERRKAVDTSACNVILTANT